MAGNSTFPIFQIPQSFEPTIPAPIDSRFRISSNLLTDVNSQMPIGVRYPGLIVWVDKRYADASNSSSTQFDGEHFVFKPDYSQPDPYATTVLKFEPLNEVANLGLKSFKTIIPVANPGQINIAHGLASTELSLLASSYDPVSNSSRPVLLDWSFDETNRDGINPDNKSSYAINSRFHAIILDVRITIPKLTLVIVSKI